MKIKDMTKEERRKYDREMKQSSRAKQKQQVEETAAAQKAREERYVRLKSNPHFFGEVSPGNDAKTAAEEIAIHREFLRALEKPDVQHGETLRQLSKRTFEAWIVGPYSMDKIYVPAFNRGKQRFDDYYGFELSGKPFEEIWQAPEGSQPDEPIDIATLPPLPYREVFVFVKPKVEQEGPRFVSDRISSYLSKLKQMEIQHGNSN